MKTSNPCALAALKMRSMFSIVLFSSRLSRTRGHARPFSLTGIESPKASYNFARFGANVGGPLNIPKIFNGGNKWFFFGGWNGSRGSTPYDSFSTVPTVAERSGDLSGATYKDGSPIQIFDPATGQPMSSIRR